MCSEQELEMARIEDELRDQLSGFAQELSEKYPQTSKMTIETKVNHAIRSAASFLSTTTTSNNKRNSNKKKKKGVFQMFVKKKQQQPPPPPSQRRMTTAADPNTPEEECILPANVDRARDCAANDGECSLEELEMLEQGKRERERSGETQKQKKI